MSNELVLDTRFRAALRRMQDAQRLQAVTGQVSTEFEIASMMKQLDGGPALLFNDVAGHDLPIVGNLLCCRENVEAAFGTDFRVLRSFITRALGGPIEPVQVSHAPCQQVVLKTGFDLGKLLPVLRHAPGDGGRFITAGVVICRDPDSGVCNASYHRLQVVGPDRLGIKLDYGRHLRLAFERAQKLGQALPIAICLGTDIALQYTAATMGSQLPENMDELAVAGGLSGRALPITQGVTVPLPVPAETEIVIEGLIQPSETISEGPFGEFVGFAAPAAPAPVIVVSAVTHRRKPIYPAINGYGRETVMLRKYVLEASLLKAVQPAVPIVVDADMTAGGLHRFHAIIQVKKTLPTHEGLQRNAMLAAFAALKDLDLVIVVDDDIDIRDWNDVEYALATRMEASRDLIVIPEARGHEYVRAGRNGIRAKLGIDATVPPEERERFTRVAFKPVEIDRHRLCFDRDVIDASLME